MRRFLAITLFAVLTMPVVLPLVASPADAESLLPACCRRNGKHHCAMMATMERESRELGFGRQPDLCPYRSSKLTLAHTFSFYPPASFAFYAAVLQHPAVHQQTAIRRLVAEARCHQKRGPPSCS
jgi:hypothetical protein